MQDDPPQDEPEESQSKTSDASGIIEDNNQSGIIDSDPLFEGSGVGSALEEGPFGIDYAKKTFSEFFFGGYKVEAWDVNLGEFLNDVEDDPDAAPMQDDPLKDVMEDDDFFGEEVGVTAQAPAPGMTQGTYVGEYGDSGDFPYVVQDDVPQRFSTFTTLSLFACLVVMVIGTFFLIRVFLGYV